MTLRNKFKMKRKTAIIGFYPVYPAKSGSAVVSYSFFKCYPGNKKLFQILDFKITIKKKNISSTILLFKHPFFKLLSLPFFIFKIFNYLKNASKPILIIEGASWMGFSYIVFAIIKLLIPKVTMVYRGQSIEYEIRKKNSSFIIANLTKFLENRVVDSVDFFTAVSKLEQKKILNYYNKKVYIFPNAVTLEKNKKKITTKLISSKFILYPGSYDYPPNKEAIDILINQIMPKVIEKNNHIKLVLTGGPNVYEDKSFVVNLGVVPKSTLINLYKTCICLPVPIFEAYGSRIKIIEALIIGSVVLSTSKGIEGLDYNKKSHAPIVTNIISEFSKIIIQISKSKKFKKDALKDRNHYLNNYGMENQVKIFYLKFLNKIS
jgi:glycosyltransferase involved in cell wall biosynthesis